MKIHTYDDQPNNGHAWALGDACTKAAADPKCGDYIDRGLILLRELQSRGYGIALLGVRECRVADEVIRANRECAVCGEARWAHDTTGHQFVDDGPA